MNTNIYIYIHRRILDSLEVRNKRAGNQILLFVAIMNLTRRAPDSILATFTLVQMHLLDIEIFVNKYKHILYTLNKRYEN
jgi:hypothetical protein